ncbi:MAG: tRNA dihydrouridine synthase [Gammaproteobacteria bacterium]
MIKPLVIAQDTYTHNLVQGPLAGVSCAPFRALAWQHSKPAFSYTEMISCKTLIHQSKSSHIRFVQKAPHEGPVCFQLSAKDPKELGLGTKIVTDYGADLIDLNCGCPVKKIRSKGAGSHLLSEPTKIYQLIRAMKANTDRPVSIKIRVDARSDDQFNEDIAKSVADAGADFITVHGRHWTEGYDVSCSYDDIRFFVESLKIPVIGNGDIACAESLRKMLQTGCAGAMIGRAGVGQPWIIAQLIAELQETPFQKPSIQEIGEMFLTHVKALSELLQTEKFAIIQARKFAKYYARTMPHKQAFFDALTQCDSIVLLTEVVRKTYVPPAPIHFSSTTNNFID